MVSVDVTCTLAGNVDVNITCSVDGSHAQSCMFIFIVCSNFAL